MHIARGIFSGLFGLALAVVLVVLGLVVTLNSTILDPSFVVTELDKMGAHAIIADQIRGQLPSEEPQIAQIIDETMGELEPWLREQTAVLAYAGCAYLKGEQELSVTISLEVVRVKVKEKVAQTIRESLPPELEGASASQIEFFISQLCTEIDSQIPEQIEVNEASLGRETAAALQKAREVVSYVQLGYKVLIGVAVLLVLLIALVQWWRVKAITRYVGIAFAVGGVVSIMGSVAAWSLVSRAVPSEIPPEIAAKLPQLISDLTHPLQIYGVAFLVAGIVLIILSIVLKSSGAEYN